jgi:hypothetical protein
MAKQIRSLLADLQRDELLEIINELCKLSKQNKQFVEVFVQGSDAVDYSTIVEDAKKKIYGKFFTPSGNPRTPKLGEARKIVTETAKMLKGQTALIAELKLYFVIVGTKFTGQFGDMYDGFYNSMLSMFEGFLKEAAAKPKLVETFMDELWTIHRTSRMMGWGYQDQLEGMMEDFCKQHGVTNPFVR